jgi:hypothetical protein
MAEAAVDELRVTVEQILVEPVLVDVEQDATWWPGVLDAWARWDERGWQGRCSWSTSAGHTDGAWLPADRIRRRA